MATKRGRPAKTIDRRKAEAAAAELDDLRRRANALRGGWYRGDGRGGRPGGGRRKPAHRSQT